MPFYEYFLRMKKKNTSSFMVYMSLARVSIYRNIEDYTSLWDYNTILLPCFYTTQCYGTMMLQCYCALVLHCYACQWGYYMVLWFASSHGTTLLMYAFCCVWGLGVCFGGYFLSLWHSIFFHVESYHLLVPGFYTIFSPGLEMCTWRVGSNSGSRPVPTIEDEKDLCISKR